MPFHADAVVHVLMKVAVRSSLVQLDHGAVTAIGNTGVRIFLNTEEGGDGRKGGAGSSEVSTVFPSFKRYGVLCHGSKQYTRVVVLVVAKRCA